MTSPSPSPADSVGVAGAVAGAGVSPAGTAVGAGSAAGVAALSSWDQPGCANKPLNPKTQRKCRHHFERESCPIRSMMIPCTTCDPVRLTGFCGTYVDLPIRLNVKFNQEGMQRNTRVLVTRQAPVYPFPSLVAVRNSPNAQIFERLGSLAVTKLIP